jgi:hypothetical protein
MSIAMAGRGSERSPHRAWELRKLTCVGVRFSAHIIDFKACSSTTVQAHDEAHHARYQLYASFGICRLTVYPASQCHNFRLKLHIDLRCSVEPGRDM